MQIHLLSGGAAQALVQALTPRFRAETGCDIVGTFNAVGAMRDHLLAGAPADLLILTSALIAQLARDGYAIAESARDLGPVRTAIAVRSGDAKPAVATAADLRAALMAADGIYFPDPNLATAGIHFAKVLDALDIAAEVQERLRPFPNGATAMRGLAACKDRRPIGCTQVTEILHVAGVELVAPLPAEFELATVYTVAVASKAAAPDLAGRFAALLAGDSARDLRVQKGFGR